MLAKRIIPCLDVKDGRVVKGSQFVNLRDAGDPVEAGCRYDAEGADELVFLDITASSDARDTMLNMVEKTAASLTIPFTVGGGIRSVEDMEKTLRAGADKISVNTSAFQRSELISEGSRRFGAQCIVVAIDAKKREDDGWEVFLKGGREPTGRDVVSWAMEAQEKGAGEILLTSMDSDGMTKGYDIPLLSAVSNTLSIPVIASGGAGEPEHLLRAFRDGHAHAVLAASIFHYQKYTIGQIKAYLHEQGISVRIEKVF